MKIILLFTGCTLYAILFQHVASNVYQLVKEEHVTEDHIHCTIQYNYNSHLSYQSLYGLKTPVLT